jgi:hypothetical protein
MREFKQENYPVPKPIMVIKDWKCKLAKPMILIVDWGVLDKQVH